MSDKECCDGTSQAPDIQKQCVSGDQVAWINAALSRYAEVIQLNYPAISRHKDAARVAAILEILEILHCQLQDRRAVYNVLMGLPELRRHLSYQEIPDNVPAGTWVKVDKLPFE